MSTDSSSGGDATSASPSTTPATAGSVERAITRIEPVSALKVSLVFNLSLLLVWVLAMALIYVILGGAGVWDKLNGLVGDLTDSAGLTSGMYFGAVIALGLLEVVIFTLLAPLAAMIYNSAAVVFGGLRITLDR